MGFSISPGVYVHEKDVTIFSAPVRPLPSLEEYPYQFQSFELKDSEISSIVDWCCQQFGSDSIERWDYYSSIENRIIYNGIRYFFLVALKSESDRVLFLLTWADQFANAG